MIALQMRQPPQDRPLGPERMCRESSQHDVSE
jgi:hypothetical protein